MLNIGFRAKHVPLHCNYNNMITNLKKIKIKSLGRGVGEGVRLGAFGLVHIEYL